jgi:hypothetical protein
VLQWDCDNSLTRAYHCYTQDLTGVLSPVRAEALKKG